MCNWMDTKQRQNRVYSYVCRCIYDKESTIWMHICVVLYCAAITCSCNNGVAQTGSGCAVDGAAKCASCNPGWTINRARTKCKRT